MNWTNDARYWKSLWSMRFIIATTFFSALVATYMGMPDDWKALIPHWLIKGISVADFLTGGAAGVSRVIKQTMETGNG